MVSGVRPNLVLVAIVLVTSFFGFGQGISWAFLAGTTANLLGFEPLGTVPLGLLFVAALVAATARLFGRLPWVFPVAAAAVGSVLFDGVTLGVLQVLGTGVDLSAAVDLILPAAGVNAAIAVIFLVPFRLLAARTREEERPAW